VSSVALAVSELVLGPGESDGPYRYLLGNEQWLLVLSGRPTLRHLDGVEVLEPGDLVAFGEGPSGAHEVRCDTDEPARVLVLTTSQRPFVEVRPDTNERLVHE
jgi:uncharacterized cupin superfamily protein